MGDAFSYIFEGNTLPLPRIPIERIDWSELLSTRETKIALPEHHMVYTIVIPKTMPLKDVSKHDIRIYTDHKTKDER